MTRTRSLLVLAPLLAVSCQKQPEKEKAPPPVQVTSVTQATIRKVVEGEGALYPIDQASLVPKISAPIQRFYVNRGDRVRKGQLLAVLENRDLIDAAAESRGAVEQAQSNLRTTEASTVPDSIAKAQTDADAAREARDNARKVLESRQQLFKQGALAGRQVDESQAAYAQAQSQVKAAEAHLAAVEAVRKDQIAGAAAQVQSAKAHLDSQQVQIAYSQVVSPMQGIIADRPLNAGEMANAGAPLLTVMDTSRVVARVNVPQVDASTVRAGQTARVTQPDSKDEVTGKVTVVSPASDPNTTTVQVWIQIENPDGRLKPGAAVHASIATEEYKAATVVPAAAILPGEEGGTAVLTVAGDSVVHRRKVALGVREGTSVQILSGVSPGEEVVMVGGLGLDDNTKVKIVTTAVEESSDDEDQNEPAAKTPNPAKKDPTQPTKR